MNANMIAVRIWNKCVNHAEKDWHEGKASTLSYIVFLIPGTWWVICWMNIVGAQLVGAIMIIIVSRWFICPTEVLLCYCSIFKNVCVCMYNDIMTCNIYYITYNIVQKIYKSRIWHECYNVITKTLWLDYNWYSQCIFSKECQCS